MRIILNIIEIPFILRLIENLKYRISSKVIKKRFLKKIR